MINETITNAVIQLTSEQISGMMQDRVIGLLVSIGLTALGGFCGARIRNDAGKIIGSIIAILGAIGTITFTLQLINLSTQMA